MDSLDQSDSQTLMAAGSPRSRPFICYSHIWRLIRINMFFPAWHGQVPMLELHQIWYVSYMYWIYSYKNLNSERERDREMSKLMFSWPVRQKLSWLNHRLASVSASFANFRFLPASFALLQINVYASICTFTDDYTFPTSLFCRRCSSRSQGPGLWGRSRGWLEWLPVASLLVATVSVAPQGSPRCS